MPPDNVSNGEMKCFFCKGGKETPFDLTFTECTAEDFVKDLKDVMQKVQDAPKRFTPTHVMADLKCRPKKIKDFILDMQTQLDSRAEARAKYRNYKIPRRRRMILKAAKMNKHNIYVFCIPPINLIETKFFFTGKDDAFC